MNSSVRYLSFSSTRSFGVEMELSEKIGREAIAAAIRGIDPGRQVEVSYGWNMTGGMPGGASNAIWSVKTDSTCANTPGMHGYEVASPKMLSAADVSLCGDVADSLHKLGCEVNSKCGVHVHADISDMSPEQVGVMIARWIRTESILSQSLPMRRRYNQYARLMRSRHRLNQLKNWSALELYRAIEPSNLEIHHNEQKRVAINLIGYAIGRKRPGHDRKTAELRLPEGSLDREDVEGWIRLYVHFVQECIGKEMPADLSDGDLGNALDMLGLGDTGGVLILDPALYRTKVWFLRRILNYTTSPELFRDAIDHLNLLLDPIERFVQVQVPPAASAA